MAAGPRQNKPFFFILALPVAFVTLYLGRDQFLPQINEQVTEAFPQEQIERIRSSFQDVGGLIIRELFSDADSDEDGLSTKLELLLQSDPDRADSDQDGNIDGAAFSQGLHPVSGNLISDASVLQNYRQLIEQYPAVKDRNLIPAYTAARLQSVFLSQNTETAENLLSEAIQYDPHPEFFSETLRLLGQTKKTEHALLVAALFVEEHPDLPEAYAARGFQHQSAGDADAARADYLTAAEMDTENAIVWNNLGLIYFEERLYEDALQAFERAAFLSPGEATFQQRIKQIREFLPASGSQATN